MQRFEALDVPGRCLLEPACRRPRYFAGPAETRRIGPTRIAVTAERAFLVLLGAGCETPVGVRCAVEGEILRMWATVFDEERDASAVSVAEGPSSDPAGVAALLREQLQNEG